MSEAKTEAPPVEGGNARGRGGGVSPCLHESGLSCLTATDKAPSLLEPV